MITILFAEDNERYRKLIINELALFNIVCIGEANNGRELLNLLRFEDPNVILLDLQMPEMDGNETMSRITELYPQAKVIILSLYADSLLMENYLERGAKTYLPKDEISGNISLLVEAIRKTHKDSLFKLDLDRKRQSLPSEETFTIRQKEIIPLICDGLTNKEIAKEIGILERSVEKQRRKIYDKTNSQKTSGFLKNMVLRGLHLLGRNNRRHE